MVLDKVKFPFRHKEFNLGYLLIFFAWLSGCTTPGPYYAHELNVSEERPVTLVLKTRWGWQSEDFPKKKQFTKFYGRFVSAFQNKRNITSSGGAVYHCEEATGYLVKWNGEVYELVGEIDPNKNYD